LYAAKAVKRKRLMEIKTNILGLLSVLAMVAFFQGEGVSASPKQDGYFNSHPEIIDPNASNRLCSEWLTHRRTGSAVEKENAAWVLGYFSGYNVFDRQVKRPFLTQDSEVLLQMIDKGCAKNAKAHISTVAVAFINDLKRSEKHFKAIEKNRQHSKGLE